MSKLPYCEGTWFAVPLKDGGHGVGLVARSGPKGRVLLGYFFGPRREELPTLEDLRQLTPSDAVLVRRFGELHLIDGAWPEGDVDGEFSPPPTDLEAEDLRGFISLQPPAKVTSLPHPASWFEIASDTGASRSTVRVDAIR